MDRSGGTIELYGDDPQTALPLDVFCPQELLSRCLGKQEFATRIIERFQSCFVADVTALKRLHEANDWPGIACLAHRLKGAAASIGAKHLWGLMAELEVASQRELAQRGDELLRSIVAHGPTLTESIDEWRNGR